jgi:hypothetical protein
MRTRMIIVCLLAGILAWRHAPSQGEALRQLATKGPDEERAELQRWEDSFMLARALVYLDLHPANPAAVDEQRVDEHKRWLAQVECELARRRPSAER